MDHPLITTLKEFNGFYECPKDATGKRLGPLVGYTARYHDEATNSQKQWVGDVYLNLTVLERRARRTLNFVGELSWRLEKILDNQPTTFCGLPEGGKWIAQPLASWVAHGQYIYPEKEVLELKTSTSKEKSRLIFSRHQGVLATGIRVVLVDDVMNNFSTAGESIDLVTSTGATVIAIAGFVNRSVIYDSTFSHRGTDYPIVSLLRMPIPEFHQDDECVAADVQAGNVCWNPKADWSHLQAIMEQS